MGPRTVSTAMKSFWISSCTRSLCNTRDSAGGTTPAHLHCQGMLLLAWDMAAEASGLFSPGSPLVLCHTQ